MTVRAETSDFAAYQPEVISPRVPAQNPERIDSEAPTPPSDPDPLFDQLYDQEQPAPPRPWDFTEATTPTDIWEKTVETLHVNPNVQQSVDQAKRRLDAWVLFGDIRKIRKEDVMPPVPDNFDDYSLEDPPLWSVAYAAVMRLGKGEAPRGHSAADTALPVQSPPAAVGPKPAGYPGPV